MIPPAESIFPASSEPQAVVLMGVAGSGKTTVGQLLATQLGWEFRDADEFHPAANIAKMSAGVPLTDDDRGPWLSAIRRHLETCFAAGRSTVVTCSALRQRYRDALIADPRRVHLVHLTGSFDLILGRMQLRTDHFMKPGMLRSQFEALEPPADAITVDIAHTPADIVAEIRHRLKLSPAR
jgi:gluconokinase